MISVNKKSFGFVTLMLLGASAQAMDVRALISNATTMPRVPYLPRVVGDAKVSVDGNTVVAAVGGLLVAKTLYTIYSRRSLALPNVGIVNKTNDINKTQDVGVQIADVSVVVAQMPNPSTGVVDLALNTSVGHPAVNLKNAALALLGAKGTALAWNYGAQLLARK